MIRGYGASSTHQGNDYNALDITQNGCDAWNDPVLAVESGTVEYVRTGQPHQTHTPSYGNYVRIRHSDGSKSTYAHLNQVNV